jgi:hypothetical protein
MITSWVVVLLVRFPRTIRVADLSHQVILLVEDIVADTAEVGPLHVCVQVDLDHTVSNCLTEVVDRATGATVEDEEHRLVVLSVDLLLDVLLVLLEKLRAELDVSWGVDTVDVAESCGDGAIWVYEVSICLT